MTVERSSLESMCSTLEDITGRLGAIAASAGEDDDIALELFEVERQLLIASRRLAKAARRA